MKLKVVLFLAIVFSLNACINEPESLGNTNKGNFESLWRIIDTRYCYLDYKEINWDSIQMISRQIIMLHLIKKELLTI